MTYLFLSISKNMKNVLNKRLSDYGVTAAQFSVMNQIDIIGEGSKSSIIAEVLGADRPTVSAIIQRLYQHKLVTREDDPLDRRSKFIALTDKGIEKLVVLREIANELDYLFFDHLTENQKNKLKNSLIDINNKLEVMNE